VITHSKTTRQLHHCKKWLTKSTNSSTNLSTKMSRNSKSKVSAR